LRQYFDVPTTSRTAAAEIDRTLVSQVRLFINGANANQVQLWLSSYEASPPHSSQRSIVENILRAFVEWRSQMEKMKSSFADTHNLMTEVLTKRAELISIMDNACKQAQILRQWPVSSR